MTAFLAHDVQKAIHELGLVIMAFVTRRSKLLLGQILSFRGLCSHVRRRRRGSRNYAGRQGCGMERDRSEPPARAPVRIWHPTRVRRVLVQTRLGSVASEFRRD